MQKKIIALAIAAAFAAPVAMADTANVNVYGSLDAGLRSTSSNSVSQNTFSSGNYNSNRWGIKGSEDLGDGMKAFWGLESNLNLATGQAGNGAQALNTPTTTTGPLFDRNATIGLSSGAHAVEFGRQRIVAHKLAAAIEPLGFKFRNQSNSNSLFYGTANRLDNLVSYTGSFGDVKVMADHNIPAPTDTTLSTNSIGVGYVSGPLSVSSAYSITRVNNVTFDDTTYYLVGAAYKFGDFKVSGGLTNNTAATSTTTETVSKNRFVGGSYDVSSKIALLAAYYRNIVTTTADITGDRSIVGVTYALSKRTTAYANLDRRNIESGPVTNIVTTNTRGASLGLATTF